MTRARHSWWAELVFRPYLERLAKKHFHALKLIGDPPQIPSELPLLIIANHGTWWDGFFVYLLNLRVLHRTLYVMMLEEQLERYSFFSRVGAFGIRQGMPRSVIESLGYSAGVLHAPGTALCLFPQGEMRSPRVRPLGFQRGVEKILAMHGGDVCILPVAMRCEHLGNRRPEAFFLADRTWRGSRASFPGMPWLERMQESQMDRLEEAIEKREPGHVILGG